MKKKILLLIICVISLIAFNRYVYAANEVASSGDTNYNTFKTNYTSNKTITVTGNGTVTLYGTTTCSTGSCSTIKYQGDKTSSDEALKSAVKCSNGEKYITISKLFGDTRSYDADNKGNLSGEIYFSEDYSVTCTSDSTGSVVLSSGSTTSSSGTTTTKASSYSSSSTTSQSNTGITTYYIVLGLIAFISYIFMIVVKKFNLFKNV